MQAQTLDLTGIVPLARWHDPVITTKSERFLGEVEEAKRIERELIATMKYHRGLGLSACQVGLSYQVIALNVEPLACLFNARVVDQTEDGEFQDEACLTFPGIVASVWRPKAIKVRFQTSDGQMHNEKYSGMTARVLMHELEHQNGRVFFDELGKMSLTMLVKKSAKKYGKTYEIGKLWQVMQRSRANA